MNKGSSERSCRQTALVSDEDVRSSTRGSSKLTTAISWTRKQFEELQQVPAMLTEKERPRVIVLVESDQMLQELMKRFLAEQAYSVFAERDGKGGLWYFKHDPGPIDLLIADVVLPDQNGVTFAHLVQNSYPETRILLTGYVEPGLQEEVDLLGVTLLAKPFKRRQFLNVIADLLETPAPPGAEDTDDTEGQR